MSKNTMKKIIWFSVVAAVIGLSLTVFYMVGLEKTVKTDISPEMQEAIQAAVEEEVSYFLDVYELIIVE